MRAQSFGILIILLHLSIVVLGQSFAPDSSIILPVQTKPSVRFYDPKKALLLSAILPGLGQVYNREFWKTPIVYGALFGVCRFIWSKNTSYQEYRSQYIYNINNGLVNDNQINPISGLSTSQLNYLANSARRDRDLSLILLGATYLLQIVDAHVGAHLKEFNNYLVIGNSGNGFHDQRSRFEIGFRIPIKRVAQLSNASDTIAYKQ